MSRIYQFNEGGRHKPIVVLSCANGFPPESYARSLRALYTDFHVICANMRPLWVENPPPESLKSWRQMGDDLLETVNSFTDQPVFGVGHSFGGVATVYAAIKQPKRFRKLALIDPTFLRPTTLFGMRLLRLIGRGENVPVVKGALRRRRHWENKEDALAHLSKRSLFKRFPAEVMQEFIDSSLVPHPEGGVTLRITPEWEAQGFKTLAVDVWSLPQRLSQPTLVIRGELTDVFNDLSARLFRQRQPHARIETVIGAGHLVPQEAPERVGELLLEFLSG